MAAEVGRARLVRKLSRILVTAAGCSTWGQWPAPDTWTAGVGESGCHDIADQFGGGEGVLTIDQQHRRADGGGLVSERVPRRPCIELLGGDHRRCGKCCAD